MAQKQCPHCHFVQEVGSLREDKTVQCANCKNAFKVLPNASYSPEIEGFPTRPSFQKNQRIPQFANAQGSSKKRKRPTITIEGYELIDELGKGGMGSVYLAIQKSLGRKVAIKVLDAGLARQQASILRFTKEAATMAKLSHPNIVYVIDRGVFKQRYFFVMEYINGCSLRDLLKEGPFSPQEALKIMLELTQTLEYAHGEGVIHRDIKPENILYTTGGMLKLADFGLVSVQQETTHIRKLTKSHVSMGTECYMAPEQRRDAKNVDQRADIYSMGVIMHELVTHRLPFPHLPTPEQVILKGYPKIDAVIRRCLETSPLKRYETTTELRVALQDALQFEKQPVYDTVIETPAVEEKIFVSKNSFLQWPTKMKDSWFGLATRMKAKFQKDLKKHLAWGGGILACFFCLVLLIALFVKKPNSSKNKQDDKSNWTRISAKEETLPDHSKKLQFSFREPQEKDFWGILPRKQWILHYGSWNIRENGLEQNTYSEDMTFNHRNCWALYKGFKIQPKELQVDAEIQMNQPLISHKEQKLPIQQYLQRFSSKKFRKTKRYPTIGVGLKGLYGAEISLLLRPNKGDLRYFLRIRAAGDKSKTHRFRTFDGFTKETFHFEKKLKVQLRLQNNEVSAYINERLLEKIPLKKNESFPSFLGLICRDAYCRYQSLQIKTFSTKKQDS